MDELKIDYDLDKEDPCITLINLLKTVTFFTFLYPAIMYIYATAHGIHIRILLGRPLDRETHLMLRTTFGDDRWRVARDIVRMKRNYPSWNVLFTWRRKKWDNTTCAETPLDLKTAIKVLEQLCYEKTR